jgi:outer membrane immunogenic protein
MKKILVAGIVAAAFFGAPAIAADMPVKAPYTAPMFNWTGFYVGGTAGYVWNGDPAFTDPAAGLSGPSVKIRGGIFGGELGYNWQVGNFVYGIETDLQNGPSGRLPQGTSGGVTAAIGCGSGPCRVDTSYFGTVRGRLGVANNQSLFYATGGWAYGHTKAGVDNSFNSINEASSHADGWTAGAGIEYAFSPTMSMKVEYLHVDFGRAHANVAPTSGGPLFADPVKFDLVRAGLNWKFGDWGKGPVSAKY